MKSRISVIADVAIVLFFCLLWAYFLTGGFVFDLFGLAIRVTSIKWTLIIITSLWLLRRLFLPSTATSSGVKIRRVVLSLLAAAALVGGNRLGYRYLLDRHFVDFDGYRTTGPRTDAPAGGLNVLFISIDTLRSDHLGCYGYGRNTSPHIDALAARGVRLENHIASAPSTLPSHASMMTSLYPSAHGAEVRTKRSLGDEVLTLAEALQREGYRTAAFTGGGQLNRSYHLDQGFDVYSDRGGGVGPVVNRTIQWLDAGEDGGRPFFLFVHTYEPHHPYNPPAPYDSRFTVPEMLAKFGNRVPIDLLEDVKRGERVLRPGELEHIEALYDGEIRYTDDHLERLFESLRDKGLWERTLVIFTSDHGEEFGEHGVVGWHGHTLYDELLLVPLIVRFPGDALAGRVVTAQTRSVDLYPTILDVVGVKPPDRIQGVSILPLLNGREGVPPLPAFSQQESWQRERSLRFGGYKLIVKGDLDLPPDPLAGFFIFTEKTPENLELYDLGRDPGEHRPLRSRQSVTRTFLREARSTLDENILLSHSFAPGEADVDDALKEQIKALGYIQ